MVNIHAITTVPTPPRQRYFCHPTEVEWLQIHCSLREDFNVNDGIFIWTFGRRVVKRDLAGKGHYSVQQIDDLVIKNTILKFFCDMTTNSISMLFYSMLSHAISFNAVWIPGHTKSPISFDNPNSDACIILHLPDSL